MTVVVCGVDESPTGARSPRVAGRIAAGLGARVMLVHAAPPPYVSSGSPDQYEQSRRQAAFDHAGYVQTVLSPITVDAAVDVERTVEFGAPADVLRSVAERERATFVVVGFRGMTTVEDVWLGSTSSSLAQECPCPVVLTPDIGNDSAPDFPGAALVCGVDGSETAIAAAESAAELADRLGVRLVVVHVGGAREGAKHIEGALEAIHTRSAGARVEVERRHGRVAGQLAAVAREYDAGLVAVGSRGRGAITAALLGSVSRRLVKAADRSIMIVSPRALEPPRAD